jgi:hypothetical protein
MQEKLNDLFLAHRRLITFVVVVIIVQFVDSETIDWAASVLGGGTLWKFPNDPDAVRRVYKK